MADLSKRAGLFTESVIREMTRVANRFGAINLSQGFPDFDPPAELVEAAAKAMRDGWNQYAITWGSPRMREALAEKQSRFMGLPIDPDRHLVVTCGGTEAMMAAMMAVCNPGDRVIVFSPFYENYAADAILSGAEPVYVPLHPPAYRFDPAELKRAFALKPKALVLCNPSNPCGRVFTREELEAIAGLAQEHDTWVIMDEVYEHIVYAPHRHVYMASLPGMFERTITTGSLSKTYSITGWRLGYVIARPDIIGGVRKVHDFLTVGAPAPLQEAAAVALRFPDRYYEKLQNDYATRRERFLGWLRRAGLKHFEPEGAYYVMTDISEFGFPGDTAFCHWLAEHIGVAAVPGSSFFREPVQTWIRFHFAKKAETLDAAGERLCGVAAAARAFSGGRP